MSASRRTIILSRIAPLVIALSLGFSVSARSVQALPWDVDMFRQQSLKANEVARSPVNGTVPVGSKPFNLTTEQAEKALTNPINLSRESIWRGKRVYLSNCLTCHGATGQGDGPVGPPMAVPNLLTDFYKGYGDGKIYGILMNGGSNMPRYGYKLSEEERWDVINYVRFLQGKTAEEISR
jgi:S-disulfanyl-L-cysteine oxidoreductase SoxD